MAYVGFKALVAKGVPPGAAANIGRKKYGKSNFQKHAAEGKTMEHSKPLKKKHDDEEEGENPAEEATESKAEENAEEESEPVMEDEAPKKKAKKKFHISMA